MELKKIADLLGNTPISFVSPIDTIRNACLRMTDKNARALPVMTAGNLLGILSEKDIVQKCIAKGLDPMTTEVNAVMTTHVQTVDINSSVAHAVKIMADGHFHHLPVVRNNINVVGMICSDDIPDEYRTLHDHFFESLASAATFGDMPN